MLAPVFALLAACGGGTASTGSAPADVISNRPASYVPATTEANTADTPVTAAAAPNTDAATPATNAPGAAAAPATAATNAAPQGDKLLAMTVLSVGTTATGARDPLKQPFATSSIWNMPIGSSAQYVAANISPNPGNNIWAEMPGIDDEKIFMTPTAPLTKLNISNAAWSGKNRCAPTGGLLATVPMPSNWTQPNNTYNNSAAFLMPDKRTILQTQPLTRCTAGAPGTSMTKLANVDLYGPGITGSHGGSGLSAIGGSIRMGELRPGSTTGPRHALKVAVYAKAVLYKCSTRSACFRWPAVTADSYSVGWYGTATNQQNTAVKMGALLAIPPSKTIASLNLETAVAKQLAWTLQNYGAYIVDDVYAPGFMLAAEDGPAGSKRKEFKADWGFDMAQRIQGNTPWIRDMQKLVKVLSVVNNNSPTSIGGGGTPRQPLAPAI